MRGIIDVIEKKAYYFEGDLGVNVIEKAIPSSHLEAVEKTFNLLVECVAESDEEMMEIFLLDEVPEKDQLKRSLRRCVLAGDIVPVLCGSAFKNKGVQKLLDAVIDYLPTPVDVNQISGFLPDTEEKLVRNVGDFQPFSALAFKVMTDVYVGKLVFFRVYSGTLKKGMKVF